MHTDDEWYVVHVKQPPEMCRALGQHVAPTDIEEGMRVGVDRTKYFIHIPLPAKIDPTVTMMTVEEKPDVTYNDVGGSKEQVESYGRWWSSRSCTRKSSCSSGSTPRRASCATDLRGRGSRRCWRGRWRTERTRDAARRVIGSELVQKYVGEGARGARAVSMALARRRA